jgi:hypothetical protein
MAKGRPAHWNRSVIAHPNVHANAGLLRAMTELYSDAPGLVGNDALAEKARYRIEDDAKRTCQGVLVLEVKA